MKDFIVHSIPGSPFGRAVLAMLEEKGARYRLAALTPQDMRGARHLSLHPFGRLPILEHGDFRVYETQAILRYLDRVLPMPLTPPDAKAAAVVDQLMNINDWYLFQGAASVIGFQRVVGPRLLGLPTDEAAVAAALPKAQMAFDEVARILAGHTYLGGDTLTLADLLIAPQMDFLAQLPEWAVLTQRHPNLGAWLARMNMRACMQATTWERVAAMASGSALQKAS